MKRTKHLILTFALILLLAAVTVVSASAADATIVDSGICGSSLTWTLDSEGTLTISGTGSMYSYAFQYRTDIKTVVIGDSVTSIGHTAFYDCTSLTSVTIGDSVTSVGEEAFMACSSLTSVTIPDSVTYIGDCAFRVCSSLKSMMIPDSVTSIGEWTFRDCTSLTSVTIGNSVTSVGEDAFMACSSLTSVTIPDSVTYIGDCAFRDCSSLKSVTIPDSVTSIGNSVFSNCTLLTSVTIPDSVTSIGKFAFGNCTSLTSVTIGNGVTSIGSGAFVDCTSLAGVYITDVAAWCGIAFSSDTSSNPLYYAKNLYLNGTLVSTLTIPDGVTSIGDGAFGGCTSLTRMTISDSVTSIGGRAFRYCTSLTSVTIPDSVTIIGMDAFYDCTSLTSVTIGNSVTSIGHGAFYNCDTLELIVIPDNVTTMGENYNAASFGVFGNCDNLKIVIIGNGLSSINPNAFQYCRKLESVMIGNNVESIGNAAFRGCTSLTDVTIPDSVTSIGEHAFSSCHRLESVMIGSSVTSIGSDAFSYCSELKDVYYTGSEEQWNEISLGSNNNPLITATIHYNSTTNNNNNNNNNNIYGYCTGNTATELTINGMVYHYSGNAALEPSFYRNQFIQYQLDAAGNILSLHAAPSQIVLFEDFDYVNRTLTASGVTYFISDQCMDSDVLRSFNASLDERFGKDISIVTTTIVENGAEKRVILALSYHETLTGILKNAYEQEGHRYVVVDEAALLCSDDFNAQTSLLNQKVTCTIVDGRVVSMLKYAAPSSGSSSYGKQNILNKNGAVKAYVNDLSEAIQQVLQAIKDRVGKKLHVDLNDPGNTITAESFAKSLKEQDEAGVAAHLTMVDMDTPKAAVDTAYRALAEAYLDYISQGTLDFSQVSVKADSISFGKKILDAVINGMKGTGHYPAKTINGYTVNMDMTVMYKQYAGKITLSKSGKTYDAWVNSTAKEATAAMEQYCSQLQTIVKNAINYAAYSYVVEFCSVTGISNYTKEQVENKFKSIVNNLASTELNQFYKIITPNTLNLVAEIASGYKLYKKAESTFKYGSAVSPASITNLLDTANSLHFDSRDLVDSATSKAVGRMNKQMERMIAAFHDYIAGKDVHYVALEEETAKSFGEKVSDFFTGIIHCPVDLEVYNESGALIGYVDSNETKGEYIWYTDDIEILVRDDKKIVYYPADANITIKAIPYEQGTMNVTIEEYRDSTAVGRLVFYDVPLTLGESYTQSMGNLALAEIKDTFGLIGDNTMIKADAYISADDNGVVNIRAAISGNGEVEGIGEYVKGDIVSLQAIPNDEMEFAGWYQGNTLLSMQSILQLTAKEDLEVTAVFERSIDDSHTHTYTSAVTTDPTCTDDGVTTYTCSICGDTYTAALQILRQDSRRPVRLAGQVLPQHLRHFQTLSLSSVIA